MRQKLVGRTAAVGAGAGQPNVETAVADEEVAIVEDDDVTTVELITALLLGIVGKVTEDDAADPDEAGETVDDSEDGLELEDVVDTDEVVLDCVEVMLDCAEIVLDVVAIVLDVVEIVLDVVEIVLDAEDENEEEEA